MSVSFAVSQDQYIAAIEKINEIDSRACREKAMRDYHYHAMATNYVREYEIELARTAIKPAHAAAR